MDSKIKIETQKGTLGIFLFLISGSTSSWLARTRNEKLKNQQHKIIISIDMLLNAT